MQRPAYRAAGINIDLSSCCGAEYEFRAAIGLWGQAGHREGTLAGPAGRSSNKNAPELPIGRFLKSKFPRGNRVIFGRYAPGSLKCNGPAYRAAGIKIDFSRAAGQNVSSGRRLALGPGWALKLTLAAGPRGERITK